MGVICACGKRVLLVYLEHHLTVFSASFSILRELSQRQMGVQGARVCVYDYVDH